MRESTTGLNPSKNRVHHGIHWPDGVGSARACSRWAHPPSPCGGDRRTPDSPATRAKYCSVATSVAISCSKRGISAWNRRIAACNSCFATRLPVGRLQTPLRARSRCLRSSDSRRRRSRSCSRRLRHRRARLSIAARNAGSTGTWTGNCARRCVRWAVTTTSQSTTHPSTVGTGTAGSRKAMTRDSALRRRTLAGCSFSSRQVRWGRNTRAPVVGPVARSSTVSGAFPRRL